ncbi:MAG: chemotaxis protein CheW [Spirochaetaceae bacterium]|jgi:chemotaxis signal transduction protein|nr:chemotaxis protein CheW [Spirochaetaceae bacterium]
MLNKGLLEKITESHNKKKTKEEIVIRLNRYMIIEINKKKYAIHAQDVREIISGISIFFVPFTPPYIRGFINRHGEPYSVIDLTVIFEREKLDSSTFLILSREDDQLALLISDVLEIVKLPESDLHRITSKQEGENYFFGSISPKGKEEIFVLDVEQFLTKLEADLGGL